MEHPVYGSMTRNLWRGLGPVQSLPRCRNGNLCESELELGSGGFEPDGGAVLDDPVRSSGYQVVDGGSGGECEHACPGVPARRDAGERVFDDDALLWRKAQAESALEIRLRVGLAVRDVVRGDEE